MSKNFQKVKAYYDTGKWNAQMVRNAIGRWITKEEADEILGIIQNEYGDPIAREIWERNPSNEGV